MLTDARGGQAQELAQLFDGSLAVEPQVVQYLLTSGLQDETHQFTIKGQYLLCNILPDRREGPQCRVARPEPEPGPIIRSDGPPSGGGRLAA